MNVMSYFSWVLPKQCILCVILISFQCDSFTFSPWNCRRPKPPHCSQEFSEQSCFAFSVSQEITDQATAVFFHAYQCYTQQTFAPSAIAWFLFFFKTRYPTIHDSIKPNRFTAQARTKQGFFFSKISWRKWKIPHFRKSPEPDARAAENSTEIAGTSGAFAIFFLWILYASIIMS